VTQPPYGPQYPPVPAQPPYGAPGGYGGQPPYPPPGGQPGYPQPGYQQPGGQPPYPPGGYPDSGRPEWLRPAAPRSSGNPLPWILGGGALLLVIIVAAVVVVLVTRDSDPKSDRAAGGTPSHAAAPGATSRASSPAAAGPAPTYTVNGMDACAAVDTAQVQNLTPNKVSATPNSRDYQYFIVVGCEIKMQKPPADNIYITVKATSYVDPKSWEKDAASDLAGTRDIMKSRSGANYADLTGVGTEGYTTLEESPGQSSTLFTYSVIVRYDNVVVRFSFVAGKPGTKGFAKDAVRPKCDQIVNTFLTKIPHG
jgi:hypothetical protein